MNLNFSQNSYSELQQSAQTVRDAISAKLEERQNLASSILQLQENIDNLGNTLAKEEHAMANASILKPPSMTAVELIAKRKELEAMRGDVTFMNDAVALLDRSMKSLQDELNTVNYRIHQRLEQYSKTLVTQLASSFVESSGDEFKNLVMATITANPGSNVKSIHIVGAVCDEIFKALSYQIPEYEEARRFVTTRIEAAEAV